MPLDPNIILGVRPVQAPDALEQVGKILGIKGAMQQQELHAAQLEQAQREQKNAKIYEQAAQESGGDLGVMSRRLLELGNPDAAIKASVAHTKSLKDAADLQKTQGEVISQRMKEYQESMSEVKTPEDARQHTIAMHSDPVLGPVLSRQGNTLQQSLARIPTDPEQFQQYVAQKSMGMGKYLEANKPHISTQDTGGASNIVATPGLGGPPQVLSTAPKTLTPGEIQADKTKRDIAGIGNDGLPTGDVKEVAKAIAEYRMAPLTSMALSRPRGQQIMAEVMTQNPDYDVADAQVKFKAAKDFGTGKQGNSVRSFNVALSHLDTLDKLADALNNKDTQAINKIGNYFASQTGSAAPTNFEAAKKIVSDEIVKAIVGSGGGVTDREEAAKTIAAANSPAQLKGVISTYKELMRGQLGGLRQQYEQTTGRKDFEKYLSDAAKVQAHGGAQPTAGKIPAPPKLGEKRDGYIYKGGDPADPKSWDK